MEDSVGTGYVSGATSCPLEMLGRPGVQVDGAG